MSYMAKMGGWSILDYGKYFADDPYDWLHLGYASYLSSWSLMNTGTGDSIMDSGLRENKTTELWDGHL